MKKRKNQHFILRLFLCVFEAQMEMHPGWRNDKMLEACKKNGIHITVRLILAYLDDLLICFFLVAEFIDMFVVWFCW